MPTEITMPQLSDTMSEGTVVKWLKREGDKVTAGEKIAEVETDKAVMEMEAFDSGTLAVIVAKEGDKVAVGNPIAILASARETVAEVKQKFSSGASGVALATQVAKSAASSASALPDGRSPRWKPPATAKCTSVRMSVTVPPVRCQLPCLRCLTMVRTVTGIV